MKSTHKRFPAEKWETQELGATEKYARKVSPKREQAVDAKLNLHVISIRLQKNLIDALKSLAKEEGIGYQPYIRQLLTQHVRSKKKEGQQLKAAKS